MKTQQPNFVIFSGLPGTGKSTLACQLARRLQWPLLRIDDVAGEVPSDADYRFWDQKILVLLTIAEEQLKLGISVIADSVFMGTDRIHAQEIAVRHHADFRPVYCFVSDEKLWKERVHARVASMQRSRVATWDQVEHQRQWFAAWEPGTCLLLDAVKPVKQNFRELVQFIKDSEIPVLPIKPEIPMVAGRYHN